MEKKDEKKDSSFEDENSSLGNTSYGGWSGLGNSSYDGESEVSQSNIISQLSPASDIKEFSHYLKGEVYDPSKGTHVKIFDPILNVRGQNFILSIYKGVSSQTLRTTYLSKKEASEILKYYAKKLYPVLVVSVDEFDIKNPEMISPLFMMTMISLKALVNKAIGGGERTFIKGTYGERGMFSSREGYSGQDNEKGGFFSKIFSRKW